MINFGIVKPGSILEIPFDSFAGATGASITLTGLAVTDIEIYKDGSMTQRASDSGYALLDTDGIDLDGITGTHGFTIDLADNTTAGYFASGSRYRMVVSAVTVDAQAVNFTAAVWRIGLSAAILNTTIASVSTQTSFTLTAGPAEDNALNGCKVYLHDVASAVQGSFVIVLDYTGSTKTVTLVAAPTFTVVATDHVAVFEPTDVERIVTDIIAQVATTSEIVAAIDNDSTQLSNIAESSTFVADKMGWIFLHYTAVIGATGNDTTHLHLPGADLYGNDTLNNCLLVIYDASTGLTYSRWIEAWTSTGDLATVATLPFTPEASVDTFAILATRRDVTVAAGLDAAGVRSAVGLASPNMDTQFTGVTNRLSPLVTKTGAVVSDGGNSPTTFVTDFTQTTNDYWKDAWFKITSGALVEQTKKCTGYNGTTKALTFSGGYTGTPAAGVTLQVVND